MDTIDVITLGSDERSNAFRLEAYRQVLRPSFTEDELGGESCIVAFPGRLAVVAVDRHSGDVVGAGVSDHDQLSGVTLLSYIASRPGVRSQGVGGLVLEHLRREWSDAEVSIVLAEVHDARLWGVSENEDPQARLRFYDRNRCGLLSVPWVQPSLASGERVRNMLLLVAAGAEFGDRVERAQLLAWVDHYFLNSEGSPPVDPEFRELRQRFATDPLVVLPLDDIDSVEPLSP